MKLSIIIPVYNEEKTITELLDRVIKVKLASKITKEIIVIDDASFDSTPEILKNRKYKDIVILRHKINRGKGAAVRKGFTRSTGEILLIQDADLEYNPKDYPRLLEPILSGRTNVVFGTRLKNYPLIFFGKNKTPLPTHWLGNKFLTGLTNFLYHSQITDMETCYKIFKKEVVQDLKLKSERFEIEAEITAKILKKGFKILELPIKVKPRTQKEGKKIGWRDGFTAIFTLIKYRFID